MLYIAGANASSYVLAATDVGDTVRVVVTATNAAGAVPASSEASAVVKASTGPSAPVNTAVPTIGGSPEEGQTLSATTGSWSGSPTSFSYEWQRCEGSVGACTAIAGAHAKTYVLVSADVGHTVRVVVTAEGAGGSASAASARTAAVSARPAPVNTAVPTIGGSPEEGQTLSATTGSWSGSPTSFSYEWQRCEGSVGACTAISSNSMSDSFVRPMIRSCASVESAFHASRSWRYFCTMT